MFFYNQTQYNNVDYSYKGNGKTVKTSGCGVCSALMVLNNYYGKEVMTVAKMATFAKNVGARESGGTNMHTLLKALAKKYDITYKTTSKNAELLEHLKNGGMAILNQGDAYNVFSTAGHYVVAYAIASGETIRCLDPYWYNGKFSGSPRKSRVVKVTGNEVWVNLSQIGKATSDRNPSYYLVSFTGKKATPFKSFTGYVTASALNVRAGANITSKILGVLRKGDSITVKGQSGNWYKIKYKGGIGYVSSKYIKSK